MAKWRRITAGWYQRVDDPRTTIRRWVRGPNRWGVFHGDRVGVRAYRETLSEAKDAAEVLRDGWDMIDAEAR